MAQGDNRKEKGAQIITKAKSRLIMPGVPLMILELPDRSLGFANVYYNSKLPIVVKTYKLDNVSANILSLYNNLEVFYSIIFYSKKHNPAECNY